MHLILFGALALWPDAVAVPELKEDQAPGTLEIVLETPPLPSPPAPEPSPEPTPEPEPASIAAPEATPPPTSADPTIIRTHLTPPGQAISDEAPEAPQLIGAHHSKGGGTTPLPTPAPENGSDDAAPLSLANDAGEESGIATYGEWRTAIGNSIGQRWNAFRHQENAKMTVGKVVLSFTMDAKAAVTDVQIVSNTANEEAAKFAIRAVLEAEVPPFPASVKERIARAPDGMIRILFDFTIYPNQ